VQEVINLSKSFKSSSSSLLSDSSDPKTGCASLDCPNDQSLKSKAAISKKLEEEKVEEESLENSSPEV